MTQSEEQLRAAIREDTNDIRAIAVRIQPQDIQACSRLYEICSRIEKRIEAALGASSQASANESLCPENEQRATTAEESGIRSAGNSSPASGAQQSCQDVLASGRDAQVGVGTVRSYPDPLGRTMASGMAYALATWAKEPTRASSEPGEGPVTQIEDPDCPPSTVFACDSEMLRAASRGAAQPADAPPPAEHIEMVRKREAQQKEGK